MHSCTPFSETVHKSAMFSGAQIVWSCKMLSLLVRSSILPLIAVLFWPLLPQLSLGSGLNIHPRLCSTATLQCLHSNTHRSHAITFNAVIIIRKETSFSWPSSPTNTATTFSSFRLVLFLISSSQPTVHDSVHCNVISLYGLSVLGLFIVYVTLWIWLSLSKWKIFTFSWSLFIWLHHNGT